MVQVQLRIPDEMAHVIDSFIHIGRFRSRSEAIKSMVEAYQEREKTRAFLKMLTKRSKEAENNPERLIPLEAVK
ncbi:hypothetical protein HY546_01755 [archaeon]|nr:hypothetical protein [archaeon]